MSTTRTAAGSPWRPIFEEVRQAVGHRRDEHGVVGSINWLRHAMELHGANPNVVRNIIYRDKGRLPDKRALFLILDELWRGAGNPPLNMPELEALLSPNASAEQEVLQLLGRDKRKAYKALLGGIRAGEMPKVLVTGRPGSGKTLLTDYVQHGLELAGLNTDNCVRLEFGSVDLATSLARLGVQLGVPPEITESRLVRIATASAYAVQADAQAEVARVLLEAVRSRTEPLVLLLHMSQGLSGQDTLGLAPLRLNTPEVPRVNGPEWLWVTLIEPLARQPQTALFVTMTDLPARAMQRLGPFTDPIRLTPPTAADARRFVKARVPHLAPTQQEDIVQRAGRSFEELRTLTLLAQARAPHGAGAGAGEEYIEQLGRLVEQTGDPDLRAFLAALAVLSPPAFPIFSASVLREVQGVRRELGPFELSFLDAVPGQTDQYRSFSRQLTRELQARLVVSDPTYYRQVQRAAAGAYRTAAQQDPKGEVAARFLHHLFEARDWRELTDWLAKNAVPHAQVRNIWQAALAELQGQPELDLLAREVAGHYVKLGAYEHPDALRAFETGAASSDPWLRAWTLVRRAEGEVLAGRYERAEVLLDTSPAITDPLIRAEAALTRASIMRWRSELATAAELVTNTVRPELKRLEGTAQSVQAQLALTKATVWEGLIFKDRGELEHALKAFDTALASDDLVQARVEFQRGDTNLRLGRLDTALAALDNAVELADRSEALAQEQARYLARRGSLQRLRGDLAASRADFSAARTLLEQAELAEDDRDFLRAKIDDESAYTALALGEFEEATFLVTHALATFRAFAAAAGTSATFRVLRGTLHLATSYACRGLAQPLRLPFPVLREGIDSPDLRHARQRIDEVIAALSDAPRFQADLHRQALLLASQFAATGNEGQALAAAALKSARFPYQRAHALAARAAAQLRRMELAGALTDLAQAGAALDESTGKTANERGDAGLYSQLAALTCAAHLAGGNEKAAAETLVAALDDAALSPYHEGLLRAFGEAADDAGMDGAIHPPLDGSWKSHRRLRLLLGMDGTGPSTPARLPDALVAAWRSRTRALSTD